LTWFNFRRHAPSQNARDRRATPAVQRQRRRKEENVSDEIPHDDESAPVPLLQQLMDNPFLLLLLGVFVPMIVYVGWGVWDILTIPMAR
jgi:hypothetical protein